MELILEDIYIKTTKIITRTTININYCGIYLITGKNGTGKTTIAKTLFHNYPDLIALMLQENDLIIKEESILENIDMYQEKREEILGFFQKNELDYLINKNPKFLSGGERRLISLLRILFSDKKIIILDEPSNDIDYIMFEKIKALIHLFSEEKAILLISHDDRFNEYTKKYEIREKELYLIEENKNNYLFNNNIETIILKKIKNRNHNYIFYMGYILSLVIFMYSIINNLSSLENEEPYEKYKKGIYHISSLIGTNTNEFNDNDSLNTVLIKMAYKKNKLEYFNKLNDELKRLEIGLKFSGNTIDSIYPQQYYNKDSKSYYNMEEKITEVILSNINDNNVEITYNSSLKDFLNNDGLSYNEVILPASLKNEKSMEYFQKYGYKVSINNQLHNMIIIDFNEKLYKEILQEYDNRNNYILTEAMVKIKDNVELLDFIIDNELDKQSFLIQGYEIYLLNVEINSFNTWMIIIQSLIIYFLLIIALLFIIINIYEVSNAKKYKIYYYYGFSINEINRYQKQYYLLRYFPTFAFITCLLSVGSIFFITERIVIIIIFLIYIFCITLVISAITKLLKRKVRRLLLK